MDRWAARRDKLSRLVARSGAEGLLVTNFTNVTYLTGFTGDDSFLLVAGREAVLVSDPRYTTQLAEECPALEVRIRPPGASMIEGVAAALAGLSIRKLGVEGASMTVGFLEQLRGALPRLETTTLAAPVEQLREVKDKEEIAAIREAVDFAERAFGVLRASLRRGRSEKEVADALEHDIRLFGGRGSSFPPIVAVGPRAALPHARPTDAEIGAADFVLVDWGASGRLYKSDLTRVLVTGKISPKLERIYGVVLKAQLAAIEAIRPGATCHEVDAVARGIIAKEGFGKHFGHGLGHGIGLDIHEGPRLARNQHVPLKPGMVVTVEPGIYLEGWGGVRIEDDVLVTKEGCEVLTGVPKQLNECVV